MRVYLVVGNNAEALKKLLEKGDSIQVSGFDNNINDAFHNIVSKDLEFDTLLLIDQGIGDSLEAFAKILRDFKDLIGSLLPNTRFIFVTKEPSYYEVFKKAVGSDSHFEAQLVDNVKIPVSLLKEICLGKQTSFYEETVHLNSQERPKEKKPWLSFKKIENHREKEAPKKEEKKQIEPLPEKNENKADRHVPPPIQGNISRVVAITGHRGSGVTGTASNLAVCASNQGLKTFLLDLDLENRSINLYFSKFGDEADMDPDMSLSLVKCIMKPDSYDAKACAINDYLWVSTIAYSVDKKEKLLDCINIKRLIALTSVLKTKFNLVLLDIPLAFFKEFSEILVHLDSVGLCLNNSLYSIINTVRGADRFLEEEYLPLMKMKSRLIINRYNPVNTHKGKTLTPELTSEILCSISDIFDTPLDFAGTVPFCNDFDLQPEAGRKLYVSNTQYKSCYQSILSNLLLCRH